MKTRKIGEVFVIDRDFLQVVKGGECGKCALRIFGMCTLNSHRNIISGACNDDFRTDNELVHFEKIGEVDQIYSRWAEYKGIIHRKVNFNSLNFFTHIDSNKLNNKLEYSSIANRFLAKILDIPIY